MNYVTPTKGVHCLNNLRIEEIIKIVNLFIQLLDEIILNLQMVVELDNL